MTDTSIKAAPLNRYQVLITVIIALLLFTIVVDYMLLSALSAILLPALNLSTEQFGALASAYAFSAAISSFISTGFADRFNRKSYLLFFYFGFILGIVCCALAPSYWVLLAARIVTGIFGGIVGSTCFAIIADLFLLNQRGRVMGFVQMSYAAGQIGGLPLAIYAANEFTWQAPYWIIAFLGLGIGLALFYFMQPLTEHLKQVQNQMPWQKVLQVIHKKNHWNVFLNNAFLVIGDVLILTFDAAYMANNLKLSLEKIPLVYVVTGGVTLLFGPIFGRLSDKLGKLKVFTFGTVLSIGAIAMYSNLQQATFAMIITIHALLFIGINARMVSSTALGMEVPKLKDRGAFMAFDSSVQQLASALAAAFAGLVLYTTADGSLSGYWLLGLIVISFMLATLFFMQRIQSTIHKA